MILTLAGIRLPVGKAYDRLSELVITRNQPAVKITILRTIEPMGVGTLWDPFSQNGDFYGRLITSDDQLTEAVVGFPQVTECQPESKSCH